MDKRVLRIIKILRELYPQSHTALYFQSPLEILVATILSAQCTDKKVNEVTPGVFKKYQSAKDFAEADLRELEKEIRPTGFYRNKAKNIQAAAQKIEKDFSGKVPSSMDDLLTLPGVARKTANIVLSSAYHKAEGIAVDTHVKRLSQRLGLSDEKNPDKIERDLMDVVPKKEWLHFNYMLVNHGRKICKAKKPLCRECRLNQLCPSAQIK
ncbi:MAG: endonuclease III [Candidatus Aminicenantes bacterium]|nr:endonuclease III [Candidatus Aminicenantes bacterium]